MYRCDVKRQDRACPAYEVAPAFAYQLSRFPYFIILIDHSAALNTRFLNPTTSIHSITITTTQHGARITASQPAT